MYQISRIRVIGLIRNYKGENSPVEEKVLATRMGKVHVYQDVFFEECRYSLFPVLVALEETLSIGNMEEIRRFCTSKELQSGRISKKRLMEIYNQINPPEYTISEEQLELIKKNKKKYGDI